MGTISVRSGLRVRIRSSGLTVSGLGLRVSGAIEQLEVMLGDYTLRLEVWAPNMCPYPWDPYILTIYPICTTRIHLKGLRAHIKGPYF